MNNFLKVKDHKNLIRDTNSKAVLNIDKQALDDYRNKKKMMKELFNNNNKINKLENDINDIKLLLKQLLEKK